MNKVEYLLTCLSEEAAEIQKDCCKGQRFGIKDVNPASGQTNAEMIIEELNDLMGVVKLLIEEGVLRENWLDNKKILAKTEKVKEYMLYSKEQGTLNF